MRAGLGTPATISVPGGVPGFTRAPRWRRVPSPALRRRVGRASSGIEPCSETLRWLSSQRVIESRRMSSLERRVAVDAARAAGVLLRDEVSGARRITYKGSPTNLVTEMDQRAEAEILARLRATFPDDAILSEESGASAGRSGRRWIVDPLDGTTNYAHGLPVFGVSIALEAERRIILGVVYDPSRDELFVAERGRGATLGDAPIRVSASASLGESLLTTGFPYNI